MDPTGKHLIIEATGDIASLASGALASLTQQAAFSTGATILFSHFHPFGEGKGSTGVVVLAESHMTVHTWPEYQYAAFDIFVCGDCDPYKAVEVLKEAHPNSVFKVNGLKRGIDQTVDKPELLNELTELVCDRNPLILKRLIKKELATNEGDAKDGIKELLRFLYVAVNFSGSATPSVRVDDIWHEMILFTKDYSWLSQKLAGRFIDHIPSDNPATEQGQYKRTLDIYVSLFGQPDPRYWGVRDDINVGCSTCKTE